MVDRHECSVVGYSCTSWWLSAVGEVGEKRGEPAPMNISPSSRHNSDPNKDSEELV